MTVYFIGAGPGDPELLTLKAARLIEACPVCLYAGSLVPEQVVAIAPKGAKVMDTAPMTLDDTHAEIVAAHAKGQDVARVHSGDPSLYGAIAEQIRRLKAEDIPYEIIPGVPAYAAVPTSTIDLGVADGDGIEIEERAGDEVAEVGGVRTAPAGVRVYNPAFDVTPHRYITAIVTEEGVCRPPYAVSLRRAKEAAEERARGELEARLASYADE